MPSKTLTISVPASAANIGPGFDVLGMSLSLSLVLTAEIPLPATPGPIEITYFEPPTPDTPPKNVPLTVEDNLITRTALHLASAHKKELPSMKLHIHNEIPLGRGLGSSGAAVVGGAILANLACQLSLSKPGLLDFCVMIEGHPDNIAASLMGGFGASFLSKSIEEEHKRVHDAGLVLSVGAEGIPYPPKELTRFTPCPIHEAVKAVVVIPRFELQTKKAREALQKTYSLEDVVYNLQRATVLTHALAGSPGCGREGKRRRGEGENGVTVIANGSGGNGSENGSENGLPEAGIVSEAMQDRIHQNQRSKLVPGLTEILQLKPAALPGLLGVCMSGAGPTVLALAVGNFEAIGKRIVDIFAAAVGEDGKPILSDAKVLEIVKGGATWDEVVKP
ncbi:hypothetical protein HK104_010218 [Borealophlyctis nickersoniae]|nr:hypothetical protein HK104_010218 [Borealophlyctis nickersoniae]